VAELFGVTFFFIQLKLRRLALPFAFLQHFCPKSKKDRSSQKRIQIKVLVLSIICILVFMVSTFAQSTTTLTYDASGNRISKKMQGSSSHPKVTASPQAVNPGQSVSLVASGCNGTVRWSTGQQGISITANPTVTTQYSASCVVPGCTDGVGKVTVDVIQCVVNEITLSASVTQVQPSQPVLLSAFGCAGGTVVWSTGQIGTQITVSPTATTNYVATCTKPNCPNSGTALITVVANCVADNITTVASSPSVPYGQPCILNAYGCTGTVQWSTGQVGNSISVKVYEPATNFVAYCIKPYCSNTGYSVVSVGGVHNCNFGTALITAQAGPWNVASTWVCRRIPTLSDEVYIRHVVTVDGIIGNAKSVTLGGGYINHLNGGIVNLQPF
jgi:hypothetical protein